MDLLDLIYDTPFDPSLWSEVAAKLEALFSANSSALLVATRSGSELRHSSVDPDVIADYNERLWQEDVWLERSLSRPAGSVMTGLGLGDYELFSREYLNDILGRSNCRDSLCAMIRNRDGETAMLSLYRGDPSGPYTAIEIERYRQIAPHLGRAYRMGARLGREAAEKALFETILGRLPEAVLLATTSGQLIWANSAAETEIRSGLIIGLQHGKIAVADHVRTYPHGHENGFDFSATGGGTVLIQSGQETSVLEFSPLSDLAIDSHLSFVSAAPTSHLVLISLARRREDSASLVSLLMTNFGLTRREAEMSSALATGASVAEIAEKLSITRNTARTHLKSIMAKTDTHRQSELVRLLVQVRR